jgi:hypothetical protein
MATTTLNLQDIELTTSISTAPLNGPPSSADYNETQREILADLSSLSMFINSTMIPLLANIQSSALGSTLYGLQGSTIISDSTDTTDTFYNSVEGSSLVIGDSLRVLRALITTLQQEFTDLDIQVATLQSSLSTTNQNSIATALAGLQSTVTILTNAVSGTSLQINALNTEIGLFNGSVCATPSIPALSTQQVTANLSTPYSDNNYTPTLSLEDPTGELEIISFTYQLSGVGLYVLVRNNSKTAAISGNIHILSKHF